ncbi:Bridging integrator 2 [Liparis tanakae]|uniref:Bridging integrator 2 n=1 Tax=Liparis tanakae TaxID=230148 RepID=A0A4Z2GWR8_9TELE|nr:Bridging integrator 2 [Liparis tanakae]
MTGSSPDTTQIIELLGPEGCSQSPAGPLDAQVGGGTFEQRAAHDHVLQVGEQSWDHRATAGHRATPPHQGPLLHTNSNTNTLTKVHQRLSAAGSGVTAGHSGNQHSQSQSMSESTSPKGSTGDFAKKVQRQLSRSKEKVLQKLGKTVESRDDHFEHFLQQFNDQQTDGNRMYKDLRNYINSVRDMREASRRLSQSLYDAYETEWAGEEDLGAIVEGEDLLWNDFEVKLSDQAVRTMESYVSQFPDVREKVAKRGRKLVDYDSSLHHLEALQTAKKKDDIKINKAIEEMHAAKSVYEAINTELKEELPELFERFARLNLDLQNVIKELQAQHPDKMFALKGMQRSPDKPRHSSLSRQSSSLGVSPQSVLLEYPASESRELDAESNYSEIPSGPAQEDAAAGNERKSGEDSNDVEEEKGTKENEPEPQPPADGENAPPSESSSELLNHSGDSESLELQLSAADDGRLHIEEREDSPVEPHSPKPHAVENGDVPGLRSDTKDPSLPPKVNLAMVTTAASTSTDTVVTVVIVLILLTVAALGFLLYRYLCHNKGDYRTTGEPAPGEDPDEQNNQAMSEKKEYFI